MPTLAAGRCPTLRRLKFYTKQQEWPSHDGTRIDLSSFVALKELKASAICFLAPFSRKISKDGFYKLLPKSLEMLHVSVDKKQGRQYRL